MTVASVVDQSKKKMITFKAETSLRDYAQIFFRRKWIVFFTFMAVVTTTYIKVQFQTPVYESRVKMAISGIKQAGAVYYTDLGLFRNIEMGLTQKEMVASMPVIERAVDALSLYEIPIDYEKQFAAPLKARWIEWSCRPRKERIEQAHPPIRKKMLREHALRDLKRKISVDTVSGTNLFVIRVRDFNPLMAAIMANVISRSYIIFDLEQLLSEAQLKYGEKHPIIRQIQDNIDVMEANLSGKPLEGVDYLGPGTVKIVEQAFPPIHPQGVSKKILIFLGIFMGFFLGLVLAFIFDFLDQTIKSPAELEKYLSLPLLGTIPKTRLGQDVILRDDMDPYRFMKYVTAYKQLADQVRLTNRDKPNRSVMIAGPDVNEGTSSVIANLGFYLAHHAGMSVLIVDANYRDPSMHHVFKLKIRPGLSDVVLSDQFTLDRVIQKVGRNLHVMTCGMKYFNPLVLMDSEAMSKVIEEAKGKFDIVLVDCANLNSYNDGFMMGAHMDQVILLVSENKTRRQIIASVVRSFQAYQLNIMGAILNNRKFVIPKFIYNWL